MTYKLVLDIYGNVAKTIQKINDDGSISYIPNSDGNADYADYLRWVAEGNVAIPADPATPKDTKLTLEDRIAALEAKVNKVP